MDAMGRLLLAATVLVAATAGGAFAAPKKKIQIETTPPGAQVYVNTIEDGAVCTTPCSVEVAPGDTTLIIELDGHKSTVDTFAITKRDKLVKKSYKLVTAVGKIMVMGPRGASVLVDEEDKGKAPVEIEVAAGMHGVVMKLDGKQIYSGPVEVAAGAEVQIEGTPTVATTPVEDPERVNDETPKIKQTTPAVPRTNKIFVLAAAFDVGFRNFAYQGADANDPEFQPENEGGQVLAGGLLEVFPATLLGTRRLRGLALVVRYQQLLNSQAVVKRDIVTGEEMATTATTFWRSIEASVRHRWVIKQKATIEVGGGYLQDAYTFGGFAEDRALVPDATYDALRIAARASVLAGKFEPYVVIENRIVLSGGVLEERFPKGATANGLRAALGLGATFGKLVGRLEGSYTRYSWTFQSDDASDPASATDAIKMISASLGYAY